MWQSVFKANPFASPTLNALERRGAGTLVKTPAGERYYVGPVTPRQVDQHGLAPGAEYDGMHLAVAKTWEGARRVRDGGMRLTRGTEIWSEDDVSEVRW